MKEIKEFIINRDAMPSAKTSKPFTVIGDPGAMFTITVINEDIHYYNFSEEKNVNGVLKTALAFSAVPATLEIKTLDSTGVYNSYIEFPAITDDDHYIITLQAVGETNLSKDLIIISAKFKCSIRVKEKNEMTTKCNTIEKQLQTTMKSLSNEKATVDKLRKEDFISLFPELTDLRTLSQV